MNKSSVIVTFNTFFNCMDWYIKLLEKIYDAKKVISKKDEKRELFEAIALKILCTWENFVEDLLTDCLNKDTSQYAASVGVRGLRKHLPRTECRLLLFGMSYLTFRDASEIKSRARRILVPKCNPFGSIPRRTLNKINEFYTIRNYIAHQSSKARCALEAMYKNRYRMKRFCEPGKFLMAWDKKAKRLRLDGYIGFFFSAATRMMKFLRIT